MNPKLVKNPAEMMKTWQMENLIEYRDVMTEKLNYTQHEIEQTDNSEELKWLQLELKRVKNALVVVANEISSRK